MLPAGFAAIAAGFALMAALAPTLSLLAAFIAALLIMGGTGFIFSPSQTAGLRTLPAEMNPFGVAISTTFVQIAACIGPSYTGIMSTAQAGALLRAPGGAGDRARLRRYGGGRASPRQVVHSRWFIRVPR